MILMLQVCKKRNLESSCPALKLLDIYAACFSFNGFLHIVNFSIFAKSILLFSCSLCCINILGYLGGKLKLTFANVGDFAVNKLGQKLLFTHVDYFT